MKHTWHRNRCPKCGVTRHVPPGPRRKYPKDVLGKEDRSRTESPFRYRLPDGQADLDSRPTCAAKGTSRTARRNGRARKVIAASRAGGRRLLTKEAVARLEAIERLERTRAQLENAPALLHGQPALPVEAPAPTSAPPEAPAAS